MARRVDDGLAGAWDGFAETPQSGSEPSIDRAGLGLLTGTVATAGPCAAAILSMMAADVGCGTLSFAPHVPGEQVALAMRMFAVLLLTFSFLAACRLRSAPAIAVETLMLVLVGFLVLARTFCG